MKKSLLIALSSLVLGLPAAAQFTGPSATGSAVSVAEARAALPGRDVSVSGYIVSHLREDYYTFRDATGEIRVEIASGVWRGRQVGPETKVRVRAEVELGLTGRYLWVKSLDLTE
jgi:uncharacterized protein (TIGR00156 family)